VEKYSGQDGEAQTRTIIIMVLCFVTKSVAVAKFAVEGAGNAAVSFFARTCNHVMWYLDCVDLSCFISLFNL